MSLEGIVEVSLTQCTSTHVLIVTIDRDSRGSNSRSDVGNNATAVAGSNVAAPSVVMYVVSDTRMSQLSVEDTVE